MTRIAIGSDHAGYQLKEELAEHLREQGHEVEDLGTDSEESVDYPDFGAAVARAVVGGKADYGVCVCGTGIGIGINANVVCVGARLTGVQPARDAIDAFLAAEFEGGRHQRRIDEISELEREAK
jgi:ribose 5-phosphate isomerase B